MPCGPDRIDGSDRSESQFTETGQDRQTGERTGCAGRESDRNTHTHTQFLFSIMS